jgi:hypothetical protein
VVVLPITHSQPDKDTDSIEIPLNTKLRLGLDGSRSWIVVSEANRFRWPGPDLRRTGPGDSFAYGKIPPDFFDKVVKHFLASARSQRLSIIPRTE